jgi:malonyl CoA-acyl carrier protein transacylase
VKTKEQREVEKPVFVALIASNKVISGKKTTLKNIEHASEKSSSKQKKMVNVVELLL